MRAKSRESHPYYMYEEIRLQPDYIEKLLQNIEVATVLEWIAEEMESKQRILLTGCGTSQYVCLAGESIAHEIYQGKKDIQAVSSFELLHHWELGESDLVIGVSHSGKTHMTLQALDVARSKGATTAGICGFSDSLLKEKVDYLVDTGYPYEKSLAHTISYTLSTTVLLLLFGKNLLSGSMESLPDLLRQALDLDEQLLDQSKGIGNEVNNWIFAGSGCTLPLAMEASLKIAETSYLFSMGLDLEQLLHGHLVMCDRKSLVVMIDPPNSSRDRVKEAIQAVKAVDAQTILLTSKPHIYEEISAVALPLCISPLKPIVHAIPIQLMAYYSAVNRGLNPDLIRRDQEKYRKARQLYV
ncbi:SIS domain-containing protein [Melghirimyces algeriensis]|uniref:Glutamine--fructose-6-phosphate aminotransferase [isomerizing] n=1 Tax=Melghirimyces algeriensis TaxID=910412 RepID=A0A521D5C5_9BACL|nr:SIS domain-containing protein [Melghirimyces algeriensis]SMO66889.1 SIS domain-containing protein [Melghirimyces algeriensis]